MAVKQLTINQLNDSDREKLFKVVKECSGSLTRIEGEQDYIREAVAETEIAIHEQFENLYETVVK